MSDYLSVGFTGHRPNLIFGTYSWEDPEVKKCCRVLSRQIGELIRDFNVRVFISGGALGIDQLAYVLVHQYKLKYPELNIQNILASPFKNQDVKWNHIDRKRYKHIVDTADKVVYVDELAEYQSKNANMNQIGKYKREKMQKRNEYIVDHIDILLGVFNGSKSGTKNCIDYAKKERKSTIILDPNNNFNKAV
ncbi:SLOG family protein [Guptibacillus spartinae]|uniref:SLOG family protein n=1 Tax=Guptibacillus spartinae TaxID=3025679 RepID=UPI002362E32E|nr:SLOG family protein [Pseudalkalibacillus spartinae]